jgi:hypothetical protein
MHVSTVICCELFSDWEKGKGKENRLVNEQPASMHALKDRDKQERGRRAYPACGLADDVWLVLLVL